MKPRHLVSHLRRPRRDNGGTTDVDAGLDFLFAQSIQSLIAIFEAILGVPDALPPELQNMFRPRDRSRLVSIGLPKDHGVAISQKVRVGGCILGWCGQQPATL